MTQAPTIKSGGGSKERVVISVAFHKPKLKQLCTIKTNLNRFNLKQKLLKMDQCKQVQVMKSW